MKTNLICLAIHLALMIPLPDIAPAPLPRDGDVDIESRHFGPVSHWTARTERGQWLLADLFPNRWVEKNTIRVDPSHNAAIFKAACEADLNVDDVDAYDGGRIRTRTRRGGASG